MNKQYVVIALAFITAAATNANAQVAPPKPFPPVNAWEAAPEPRSCKEMVFAGTRGSKQVGGRFKMTNAHIFSPSMGMRDNAQLTCEQKHGEHAFAFQVSKTVSRESCPDFCYVDQSAFYVCCVSY